MAIGEHAVIPRAVDLGSSRGRLEAIAISMYELRDTAGLPGGKIGG